MSRGEDERLPDGGDEDLPTSTDSAGEQPHRSERAAERKGPICPRCQRPMTFIGALPSVRMLPRLAAFVCKSCKTVATVKNA
jgi:hypothetical protein